MGVIWVSDVYVCMHTHVGLGLGQLAAQPNSARAWHAICQVAGSNPSLQDWGHAPQEIFYIKSCRAV